MKYFRITNEGKKEYSSEYNKELGYIELENKPTPIYSNIMIVQGSILNYSKQLIEIHKLDEISLAEILRELSDLIYKELGLLKK